MMNKFFKSVGLSIVAMMIAAPAFAQLGIFTNSADWGSTASPPQRGTFKIPGSVAVTGTGAAAEYIMQGNGDDIWDNNDEGFFVYTELEGSWSVSGKVFWNEPGTNDWSKIGVMIRENAKVAGSRHYWSELRGAQLGDRVDAQWRTSANGGSGNAQIFIEPGVPVSDFGDGVWLRVTRIASQNLFYSEWSEDGTNWVIGHSQTQAGWPAKVAYGLAITSHVDDDFLVEAKVSDVKISAAPPVGVRSIEPGVFGPGGVMNVNITLVNESSSAINMNVEETPPTGFVVSSISAGGTATAGTIKWAVNAAPGTTTLTYTVTAPANANSSTVAAFAGKSGAVATTGQTSVSFINILPAPAGDPLFTGHADIIGSQANLGAEGEATYDAASKEYEVVGSGNDIWNNADNFHLLFKEMSGNFRIKADVVLDVGNGDGTWAKAGPMIRDNLTAGSAHAFAMIRNQGQDYGPQWRDSQGGGGAWDGDPSLVLGANHDTTVGLERVGNEITFIHEDAAGKTVSWWKHTVPGLVDPVYAGLAVTSHSAGALSFGFFSNVAIEALAGVEEWSIY